MFETDCLMMVYSASESTTAQSFYCACIHARVNNRYMIHVMNNYLLCNTGTGNAVYIIIGSSFAAIIIIIFLFGTPLIIVCCYRQKLLTSCKRKKVTDGECGRFNMMIL